MKHLPSEGEVFLGEFFDGEGISYMTEKEIAGLKGDSKKYRKADFYLYKFNLYVEFYGRWNNSMEDRERYREKKKVYYNNKIPCVYIYPENLGIIEFSFPRRAIKAFKDHKMERELWRFRLRYLWLYKQENIILFFITLFILIFGEFKWEEDKIIFMILIIIPLYQLYKIQVWFKRKLV
jgi:hypothetical protein